MGRVPEDSVSVNELETYPYPVIDLEGKKYAILPLEELEAILEEMEDQRIVEELERESAEGAVELVSEEEMYEIIHKSPIRIAREKAGLTQEQFAKRMGVSQPQISKWERVGYNPRKTTLERICKALNVPISEVM